MQFLWLEESTKLDRRVTLSQYREYKDGDEESILNLYNTIYSTERDKSYWEWQFKNYPGGKPIICLAEDGDKLIGQTTLLPTKINYQGKQLNAGYSIDSMVDKEYRRQGIFVDLAQKSYDRGIEQGINFRYGFPIYGALLGLTEKLGVKIVDDIPVFIRIFRLDNYLTSRLNNKTLAKIISLPSLLFTKLLYKEKRIKPKKAYLIKEIDEFNEDFDKLWDKLKDLSPLMTPRKVEFLNWRIKNHPTIKYTTFGAYVNDDLVGYMVIKVEEKKVRKGFSLRVGHIIDMFGEDENVIGSIYMELKKYLKQQNIDFILSWAGDSMLYRKLLVDLGFYKTKTSIPFLVKELLGDKDLEQIVTNEANWFVLPIESDIY